MIRFSMCCLALCLAASVAQAQTSRQKTLQHRLRILHDMSNAIDRNADAIRINAERIRGVGRSAHENAAKLRFLGGRFRDEITRIDAALTGTASAAALKTAEKRIGSVESGMRRVSERVDQIAHGRFSSAMARSIDLQIRDVLNEAGGVLEQLRSLSDRVEKLEGRVGDVETRVDSLERRVVTGGVFGRYTSWGVGGDISVSAFSAGPAVSIPLSSGYRWMLDIAPGIGYGGQYEGNSLMLVDVDIAATYVWTFRMVTGVSVYYGATIGFFDHEGDVTPTTSQFFGGTAFIGWAPSDTSRLTFGLAYGDQGDLDNGHGGSFGMVLGGAVTF